MKKKKTALQNLGLLLFTALAFVACDKDFSAIGTDIIGDDNFDTDSQKYPTITYNIETGAVQSNGLASNLLGYYYDPTFGNGGMTGSYVGQMTLGNPSSPAFNPRFGTGVVLDSVVLTLPYFSRATEISDDGVTTYELDSVYGSQPINLSVYQNNYFLRDFDPNGEFDDQLNYFSDRTISDGGLVGETELEGQQLYQNPMFAPSAAQIVLMTPELDDDGNQIIGSDGLIVKEESNRISPALRLRLDKIEYADNSNHTMYTGMIPDNYWENLIFAKEGQPELSNLNNFVNYFRGLYVKAQAVNPTSEGSMMMLNFTSGNLTLHYSNDPDEDDDDLDGIPNYADADIGGDDEDGDGINDTYDVDPDADNNELNDEGNPYNNAITGSGSLILNFNNNSVNIVDSNYSGIPTGDTTNGDAQLFLKGGAAGNMAIVELFNGDDHDDDDTTENAFEAWRNTFVELDDNNEFVKSKRLVNEANLIFYVDQDAVQGTEPNRLYIFDLKNDTPLIDYTIDLSVDPATGDNKILHLEPLTREGDDPDGDGIKYKIRITEHINNILLRDSTNVRLGLAVTSSVNSINNLDIKGFDDANEGILPKSATTGAFLSPKGTILYGNNAVDPDKRVELEIFYTEPNQN